MLKTVTQEIEGYGLISKRASKDPNNRRKEPRHAPSVEVREIKGFVSTDNPDRHGDTIDPVLFDIPTYMANPQVFVDHMPWINKQGNPISVGVCRSMVSAQAVQNADEGFDIVSIETGETIDVITKEEIDTGKVLIQNQMKGLWSIFDIMEEDIIRMIDDGRLNAFSWRGDLVETRFGKSIDLMEVSLVYIPANSKALFMITKGALRETNTYVVIKGGNAFTELKRMPKDATAVIAEGANRFSAYIKKESGRTEIMPLSHTNDKDADSFVASLYAARGEVESVMLLKNTFLLTGHQEPIYEVVSELSRTEMVRSKWAGEYVNSLPDSAFAFVEDGEKDSEGKTTPRSLRHFPLKNAAGEFDEANVRNALATLGHSPFGEQAKAQVLAAARSLGIEVAKKSVDLTTTENVETVMEGGEEDMKMEDVTLIATEVAKAVGAEFGKLLQKTEEAPESTEEVKTETPEAAAEVTETKVEEAAAASAEEGKTEEASTEVVKEADVSAPDIASLIANAVKDALAETISGVEGRLKSLEEQTVVETQQPTEVEARETARKSFLEAYEKAEPKDKSVIRKKMLNELFKPAE